MRNLTIRRLLRLNLTVMAAVLGVLFAVGLPALAPVTPPAPDIDGAFSAGLGVVAGTVLMFRSRWRTTRAPATTTDKAS